MLKDIVIRNRSCRRFDRGRRVSAEEVRQWLDLARQTASGRNMQPLKYAVVTSERECARLFPLLKWAGYMPDWDPSAAESPTGYVVFLNDRRLAGTTQIDLGIQAQTLLLAATEAGFGGCIIMAFLKGEVAAALNLDGHLEPALVVALGLPAERCVLEDLPPDSSACPDAGNIRYYRTGDGLHHVPKRPLDELVVAER